MKPETRTTLESILTDLKTSPHPIDNPRMERALRALLEAVLERDANPDVIDARQRRGRDSPNSQ